MDDRGGKGGFFQKIEKSFFFLERGGSEVGAVPCKLLHTAGSAFVFGFLVKYVLEV